MEDICSNHFNICFRAFRALTCQKKLWSLLKYQSPERIKAVAQALPQRISYYGPSLALDVVQQ